MIETSARPRSRTHRADSPHRHRTVSAQRAIDRRNRRLARTMQIATGAAVRNGGATVSATETRGRSRASIKARLNKQSVIRRLRVGKLSFVATVLLVCLIGVGVTLVLSSYVASQSESVVALQQTNKGLKEHDAQLTKQLQESMSAAQLAEKATAMGMVPSGDVLTLHKEGKKVVVVGTPQAANGRVLQNINPPLPQRTELKVKKVSEPPSEPPAEKVKFEKRRPSDTLQQLAEHR